MEFNALPSSTTDTDTYFVITKIVGRIPNDYKIPISDLKTFLGLSSTVVQANADYTAQTTAIGSVTSYTPTVTGSFYVTGYINITAISGYSLLIQVTFTDVHGTVTTVALTSGGSVAFTPSNAREIRAKGGTLITVSTILSSSGSITYDCGAAIVQIA